MATPIGVISIESPVRRLHGEVFDFAEMQRIAAFARERRIALHFDGARVFLASAYTGIAPAAYAALFDTAYVSLYKYFNAGGGAVLAGPRQLLGDLYHQRRMFGGSLRQAWPYAAVALHYLDGFSERFQRAAAASETLFRALREQPGCEVLRSPASTNVTLLRISGGNASTLPERLDRRGIAIRPALAASSEHAEFELVTNETILRRPIAEIIDAFVEALASAVRPPILTVAGSAAYLDLSWRSFRSSPLRTPVSRSRPGRLPLSTREIRRLMDDMLETMYGAIGIGLAAPAGRPVGPRHRRRCRARRREAAATEAGQPRDSLAVRPS